MLLASLLTAKHDHHVLASQIQPCVVVDRTPLKFAFPPLAHLGRKKTLLAPCAPDHVHLCVCEGVP